MVLKCLLIKKIIIIIKPGDITVSSISCSRGDKRVSKYVKVSKKRQKCCFFSSSTADRREMGTIATIGTSGPSSFVCTAPDLVVKRKWQMQQVVRKDQAAKSLDTPVSESVCFPMSRNEKGQTELEFDWN